MSISSSVRGTSMMETKRRKLGVEKWMYSTGRLPPPGSHDGFVTKLTFLSDRNLLLVEYSNGLGQQWDYRNFQVRRTYQSVPVPCPNDVVVHSQCGQFIAHLPGDLTARIVDVSGNTLSEQTTSTLLTGHSGYVLSGAFSPCSRFFVTGSSDSTLRVWSTSSGRQLFLENPGVGNVWSVAFSPCGRTVACGGANGSVVLFHRP